MLNNAKLKETLSQKVTANIAEPIHTPTNYTVEPAGSEPMLPSLSVVLTFSLSLAEAASQMTRIQEMVRMLGLQPAVQQQLGQGLFREIERALQLVQGSRLHAGEEAGRLERGHGLVRQETPRRTR